jgi:hypothetical protein
MIVRSELDKLRKSGRGLFQGILLKGLMKNRNSFFPPLFVCLFVSFWTPEYRITRFIFLLLMPHSVEGYKGQSPVFRLTFAKYSGVRYFRNVDRLFLIGVGGFTPEFVLAATPTRSLPHVTSGHGYKRLMKFFNVLLV